LHPDGYSREDQETLDKITSFDLVFLHVLGWRQQGKALSELFNSMSVLGKWPENRLFGNYHLINPFLSAENAFTCPGFFPVA
jgi:hypothetical protein